MEVSLRVRLGLGFGFELDWTWDRVDVWVRWLKIRLEIRVSVVLSNGVYVEIRF